MNKNEQILVDTVGGINRLYGGATLRSGQRLLGLCMDMAPKLVGQREYKMFSNLVKCGGPRRSRPSRALRGAWRMNTLWMRMRRGAYARCI